MDQVIGSVRCKQRWIRSSSAKPVRAKLRGHQSALCDPNHVFHLIVSAKERLLVLLQITLVTGWQSLQRGKEAEECRSDPSALAAQKFPRVRIFLLRHQAAARGIFVGKDDVREF